MKSRSSLYSVSAGGVAFRLPPMTILLSFYSAQFFVLLAVSIGLPFVELGRQQLNLLRKS